ncbi:MAG: energy transducer TonB [Clostridium sp.]|nr:energy transducer TonB [Clostridium sp.]
MAKGVNLTSAEWRNIVFEGKNKDYGAYVMRAQSPKRHWLAIIGLILLLIAIGIAVISYSAYLDFKKAEEEARAKGEQMSQIEMLNEQEAQEEEEEVKYEEEPEPEEQTEEPQVASQQVTAIAIVDKADAEHEVRNMDDIQSNEAQVGAVNQEGRIDVGQVNDAVRAVQVVEEVRPEPKAAPEPEKIFEAVEQQASFPGGTSALMQWLSKNLRYPELAQQNNVQGKVIVKFTVEKDGSISNPTVVRGVDKDLDREAIRVVKKMPKWSPGKNNGAPVRSYFTLPVTFRLENM